MTTHLVTVPDTATAAEALEEIRRQAEEVEDFYQVFVVDGDRRLVGVLPFKDLVVSRPDRLVRDIHGRRRHLGRPDLDQEEVARLMARYNLPSVAVVDERGRLLGRMTFDDVIDVVEAETTEDLLKFGGVSADEELAAGWTTRSGAGCPGSPSICSRRFSPAAWCTSSSNRPAHRGARGLDAGDRGHGRQRGHPGAGGHGAPARSGAHPGRPVHPGGGQGNAGRHDQRPRHRGVRGRRGRSPRRGARLGLVVFLAMSGNLLVAGFAGAFIPVVLERFGVDPAIASSIFVTTFTDVCGFLLLLGLAGWLLL